MTSLYFSHAGSPKMKWNERLGTRLTQTRSSERIGIIGFFFCLIAIASYYSVHPINTCNSGEDARIYGLMQRADAEIRNSTNQGRQAQCQAYRDKVTALKESAAT